MERSGKFHKEIFSTLIGKTACLRDNSWAALRGGADFEILIEQLMLYDNFIFSGRLHNNLLFGLIDQTRIILSHL